MGAGRMPLFLKHGSTNQIIPNRRGDCDRFCTSMGTACIPPLILVLEMVKEIHARTHASSYTHIMWQLVCANSGVPKMKYKHPKMWTFSRLDVFFLSRTSYLFGQ
jgi:hypothetical protein